MITFLLTYPHILMAMLWLAFLLVLGYAYARTPFGVHTIRSPFVVIALAMHLVYAAMLSWGQYIVWSSSEFTKVFLESPIPSEVGQDQFVIWITQLFNIDVGYFFFYVWGHFFAPLASLLLVVLFFGLFLWVYKHYHPLKFKEGDVEVILASLLAVGWPGVLVLIPLALFATVIRIFWARGNLLNDRVYLPPMFIILAPFVVVFGSSVKFLLRGIF